MAKDRTVTSTADLYLDPDGAKLYEAGNPNGVKLFAKAGKAIAYADAVKYGLVDDDGATPVQPAPAQPAESAAQS